MLYSNGKSEPMGLINNPLTHNLYGADSDESGFPIPPVSEFRITDAGDFRITDAGDHRITD